MKQGLDWEDGRTFELEGEIVGQVAAFMVASQEEQGVGVPHLHSTHCEETAGDGIRQILVKTWSR
jgi:hypothetical protein